MIVGLLFVLITNGSAIWLGCNDRNWTEVEACRELQNLALTISEQMALALDGIDLVQNGIVAQIQAEGVQTPAQFNNAVRGFELHRTLSDRISGLRQLEAIAIVDSTGKLVNSSFSWPIPDLDVSDREYFKAVSEHPTLRSYVSVALRNRANQRRTAYIVRPVRNRDGALLGLVLAGVDLEYFEGFYQAVSLGPDSAISLLRDDGSLLARHPHLTNEVPRAVAGGSRIFTDVLSRADYGTVRQISAVDGADRFVSGRKLGRYPIVITVSTRVDRVLARWWHDVLFLVAGALLLNALIATATVLGLRQIRNHARSEHMARHDALTGLANRSLLREWMDDAMRSDAGFSLALVDLDDFKTVNDVLGHAAGDALLQKIATSLRDILGDGQSVARLGGDEFALIDRSGDIAGLCERILGAIREPIDLKGRRLVISTSIGVASAPHDAGCADELLRKADMALYAAKSAGKAAWRRFQASMEHTLLERQALEADLRDAVGENQLELYLQPIVRLQTAATTGFEALLRWRHPTRGMVSPTAFIPVAESSGLIIPIGEWVLRRACRAAAGWRQPLTISVNLSPMQLTSGDLVGTIRDALLEAGLAPSRLEVEVTETVLLQAGEKVLAVLHALRDLGVRVALDDFGTGYSSLSYLASFPFDRIKIDRSFVSNMLTDRNSATIVRATIALAGSLGLESTTEGVETAEQLQVLRDAGSTAAQGFLFGRPLPADETAERFGLMAVTEPAAVPSRSVQDCASCAA